MELIILKPAGLKSLLGEHPYAFLADLLAQLKNPKTVLTSHTLFQSGGVLRMTHSHDLLIHANFISYFDDAWTNSQRQSHYQQGP